MKDELEKLVNQNGIAAVLSALAGVCDDKAGAEISRGATKGAQRWKSMGAALVRLSDRAVETLP